jgi:hypothetical protein
VVGIVDRRRAASPTACHAGATLPQRHRAKRRLEIKYMSIWQLIWVRSTSAVLRYSTTVLCDGKTSARINKVGMLCGRILFIAIIVNKFKNSMMG